MSMTSHKVYRQTINLLQRHNCPVIVKNIFFFDRLNEQDILAVKHNDKLIEVEVKINRQDYLADFEHKPEKHRRISNGNYVSEFYFSCPEGLISVEEVPDYAGLIYVSKTTSRAYIKKRAPALNNRLMNGEEWKKLAIKLGEQL